MKDSISELSVLVVDNEPTILTIFSMEFEYAGISITTAKSGEKALKLLKKKEFDVVCTDYKMTEGDGLWLVSKIHKELSKIPDIYFFTGNDTYYFKEKLKDFKIVSILQKPFSYERLIADIVKRNISAKPVN